MPHPLEIRQVSKAFGARNAVDGVDLHVAAGEFVALLGTNGAGKTTLFQLVSGLFAAQAGSIAIFGTDIAHAPARALARLGIVFQQPALDLDLSVHDNLQFQADLHGMERGAARRQIAHLLARFQLAERASQRARTLSGGMRRKTELARALLTSPQLLLMDEATVGIDPASRMQILADVQALCKESGLGVLWATHLVDEAQAANRIVVLAKGKVKFDGAPDKLAALTGCSGMTDAFLRISQ
ncbi:MAG: ATP-binding cassette domain-containing protein [Noviherbaspirillum sp.]